MWTTRRFAQGVRRRRRSCLAARGVSLRPRPSIAQVAESARVTSADRRSRGVLEYLPLPESRRSDALAALAHLPTGCFVITSGFEGVRAGVIARAATVVADEPLLVCVSIRRGHWIEPLIRDSRAFALSVIDRDDKFSLKKFCDEAPREQDPFDCTPWESLQSQSPVLKRAVAGIDCEVVRRVDLEADCALIVGRVMDVRVGTAQNGK